MRVAWGRLAAMVSGGLGLYVLVLRHRQLQWGADVLEAAGPLPGDGLIPQPDLIATRAISIRAGADAVWPWIVQMGQGRGGLYSYDWVENLVGCQMHSADRIVPEWQRVAVGDDFRIHPDVALTVAEVDPPRAFVVEGGSASAMAPPSAESLAAPFRYSWAFVLVPDRHGTRLLVRERYAGSTRVERLMIEVMSPVSLVMTRRMLRGIRARVERTTRHRADPDLATT